MKSTARKKLSQEEAGTQTTAEERRQEMEKVTKENAGARKGRKVAKHCVFPVFFECFVAPEGRKVGSLKRQLAKRKMKNCTPV